MKFLGEVGFMYDDVEIRPDVYGSQIVVRPYKGDVETDRRKFQNDGEKNPSFRVNNRISIIADLYAKENWPSIKFVKWAGTKFAVESIEVNYPRITIAIGGPWNGEFESKTSD